MLGDGWSRLWWNGLESIMVEWIGGKYLARMLSWSKGERGIASLNPIETKTFHQRKPTHPYSIQPKPNRKSRASQDWHI